jgi:NADH-quinone oxidoreductase subunit J
MTFLQLVFYTFSAMAIGSATMVVASKNPVHGALSLVMTFVSMAGIWVILHAEFLALILVLVYVGAVMTLFLFVVMMLSVNMVSMREGFTKYLVVGVLLVALIVGLIVMVIGPAHYSLVHMPIPQQFPADYSNIEDLGLVIYTQYAYPFEIAAVLLLTSIVAAIALTHGKGKKSKRQNVASQIAIQRDQRVRLVSMPSEKPNKPSGMDQA